ncbi:MAG: hypothetical protein HY276_02555 [Ignavibacteriales bacterium]|nr:hypothetical protein [Ignavibacteriales bacterium]
MNFFKFILLIAVAALSFHSDSYAQPVSSATKLKINAKLSVDKIGAGSTFKAAVLVTIADGWHVNSHKPTSDYLIGTELTVAQKPDFTIGIITYPRGENIKLAFSEEPLSAYEKEIKIFFTVAVSKQAKPRRDTIKATLTVQACNDKVCLAPSEIEVKIPITVIGPKEQSRAINDNIFSSYKLPDSK